MLTTAIPKIENTLICVIESADSEKGFIQSIKSILLLLFMFLIYVYSIT